MASRSGCRLRFQNPNGGTKIIVRRGLWTKFDIDPTASLLNRRKKTMRLVKKTVFEKINAQTIKKEKVKEEVKDFECY